LAGFCGIYKHFSGFKFFLLPNRILVRPPASNANLWAVTCTSFQKGDKAMKKSIQSVFLAFVFLTVLLSGCASAPKAGEWKATAEFGDFVFVINSADSAIDKINFNFTSLKCGGTIISGGVGTEYFSNAPKIEKGEFTIDYDLDNSQILTITGEFGSNGETASGTWEDKLAGTVCASGKWTASPNTNTP
jgi:hypothetical protein